MAEIPLVIQADTSSVRKGTDDLKRFKTALGEAGDGASGAGAQTQGYTAKVQQAGSATIAMARAARGALLGLGAAWAAQKVAAFTMYVAEAGEEVRLLEARFRALGLSSAQALDDVERIASDFGVTVGSVADGLGRFSYAREAIGATQAEITKMAENFLYLGQVSGTTAQAAEGAMVQLGQAMAANSLMGDEFRSLSEQMPSLMAAIADEMDVPIGALKKLASEGKITGQVLASALLNVDTSNIDSLPKSMARARTGITVELRRLAAEIDKTFRISETMVAFAEWIRTQLRTVADLWEAFNTNAAQSELDALMRQAADLEDQIMRIGTANQTVLDSALIWIKGMDGRLQLLMGTLGRVNARILEIKMNMAQTETPVMLGPPMPPPSFFETPEPASSGGGGGGGGGSTARFREEQAKTLAAVATATEAVTRAQQGGQKALDEYNASLERAEKLASLLAMAKEEGISVTEAEVAAMEQAIAAVDALNLKQDEALEYMERWREWGEGIETAFVDFGTAAGGAFANLAFQGENAAEQLRSAFESFVKDLLRQLGELATFILTNKALKMLGLGEFAPQGAAGGSLGLSLGGLLGGGGGGASGGWLADLGKSIVGALPHFADGAVVSRPGVALIGEAGPEAVLPLSRGPETAPAGKATFQQTVNITNTAPGVEVETKTSDDGTTLEVLVKAAVQEVESRIRRGGNSLSSGLERAYGVTRKGK